MADRAVGPAQLDTPIVGGFGFGGAVSLADNVSQLLPVGQTPDFALGGLTVSSGKVVAPRAGVYEITAVVAFLHNANGGW